MFGGGRCVGLSPRVRGNQATEGRHQDRRGSIPASAGEPSAPSRPGPDLRVYPRECGGTRPPRRRRRRGRGLSPRVRGNPLAAPAWSRSARSIPASAGEPSKCERLSRMARVYPRECGGTDSGIGMAGSRQGLSPRVRGNRHRRTDTLAIYGSIPASAGEPAIKATSTSALRVYPRECGGTA